MALAFPEDFPGEVEVDGAMSLPKAAGILIYANLLSHPTPLPSGHCGGHRQGGRGFFSRHVSASPPPF